MGINNKNIGNLNHGFKQNTKNKNYHRAHVISYYNIINSFNVLFKKSLFTINFITFNNIYNFNYTNI